MVPCQNDDKVITSGSQGTDSSAQIPQHNVPREMDFTNNTPTNPPSQWQIVIEDGVEENEPQSSTRNISSMPSVTTDRKSHNNDEIFTSIPEIPPVSKFYICYLSDA
jgi:hypothetical protein